MEKNIKPITHTGITAELVRKSKRHTRPQSTSLDLGFSEFRVVGRGTTLWPDNAIIFKGNVSSSPQVELHAAVTMYVTAPGGGSKIVDVEDQYGSVTSQITFEVIALTDSTTPTTLRSSALRVLSISQSGGVSTGTPGDPVPFNDAGTSDGTYFTVQDNGDGTYSPVIHKAGLYTFSLYAFAP